MSATPDRPSLRAPSTSEAAIRAAPDDREAYLVAADYLQDHGAFQGELVAFLQSRPLGFDAVTAADTLCYFGALDDFAAAALSALRPGGWLVFTVEALDDAAPEAVQPGCRLQYHGRYSHARGATLAALQRAGLVDAAAEPVFLRKESGQPVQGWLVTARRPA